MVERTGFAEIMSITLHACEISNLSSYPEHQKRSRHAIVTFAQVVYYIGSVEQCACNKTSIPRNRMIMLNASLLKLWQPLHPSPPLYNFTGFYKVREFCIYCFWVSFNSCGELGSFFLSIGSQKSEDLFAVGNSWNFPTLQPLQHSVACLGEHPIILVIYDINIFI